MPPFSAFRSRAIPHHSSFKKAKETPALPVSVNRHKTSKGATPLIAVIGVGFVGTGLMDSFSSKYNIMGFDISEDRLNVLRNEFRSRPNVSFTSNEADLGKATHFLILVPTLLRSDRSIDLSYLRSALQKVKQWARRGTTVVIESSVAIGLTRELLGPIAKAQGLFASMSPERIDPGRTEPPIREIPKVISGLDDVVPGLLNAITRLYSRVFDTIVPVSKPEVTEMTKLYENCQRMICIAFANEMANAYIPLSIDPFEVSNAAGTKPFGYLPFTPSLGVGGHCIPVNPYYLLATSKFPLLEAAAYEMNNRPAMIAERILSDLMGKGGRRDSGLEIEKNVLVVGIGFKASQSHLVNSPGLKLAQELSKSDLNVIFADTLVPQADIPEIPRLADKD